ncbi:hypothetical protein [Vibrio neptunius]|uniref:ABC transporter permease n=1 Tax=Vibrio neptunius TaxID=170651 RepID=A0ABS3A0T3_9VIBR|nr:hypothetical protein [Vibrio neptunius]MBN3493184.1 hypothetical protein [Vibrio neptunius]MBN3515633.1 hypothetical protein [Vibrio neptunius]MBN3549806.1 hypothetical protein [Vibrio neptunius]MBN3577938.1 hypothetical protein [Vibrio neptunius]MCH9871602.1 hypothetical protein [Vibrio neptunius]
MNKTAPLLNLTFETKSLLAYILIPLVIVFPASLYLAYQGINDSLKNIAKFSISAQ